MAAREGTAATRIPGRNGINILSLRYRHQRKRRPFSERCGMRQPDRRFLSRILHQYALKARFVLVS